MKLVVFGANGGVGKHAVSLAVSRNHEVRAVEPDWPTPPAMGAEPVVADILEDDLAPVIEGADAVLSCVGLGLSPRAAIDPPPLYTDGTRAIVRGMKEAGVRRLVVISASFVATQDRGPIWFRLAAGTVLDRIFTQMGEMERILRETDDIDWTAVRPGWLLDAPLTGDYEVTPDVIAPGTIRTRMPDLAHFMLHVAESGGWDRRTPAIARAESALASTPDRLFAEMMG